MRLNMPTLDRILVMSVVIHQKLMISLVNINILVLCKMIIVEIVEKYFCAEENIFVSLAFAMNNYIILKNS